MLTLTSIVRPGTAGAENRPCAKRTDAPMTAACSAADTLQPAAAKPAELPARTPPAITWTTGRGEGSTVPRAIVGRWFYGDRIGESPHYSKNRSTPRRTGVTVKFLPITDPASTSGR
jgi:hypothetical protein